MEAIAVVLLLSIFLLPIDVSLPVDEIIGLS